MLVLNATLGVALGIGLDVAQVTNVAGLVRGSTVGLVVRVDWEIGDVSLYTVGRFYSGSGRAGFLGPGILTVRAGRRAAVGVVTEGVDVEAALGVGVVASDIPRDGGGSRLGLLHEGDGTGDLGVTTDDSNYRRTDRY